MIRPEVLQSRTGKYGPIGSDRPHHPRRQRLEAGGGEAFSNAANGRQPAVEPPAAVLTDAGSTRTPGPMVELSVIFLI